MVKIRLCGIEEECKKVEEKLSEQFEILSCSEMYKDREQSKYVRMYIDIELKEVNKKCGE